MIWSITRGQTTDLAHKQCLIFLVTSITLPSCALRSLHICTLASFVTFKGFYNVDQSKDDDISLQGLCVQYYDTRSTTNTGKIFPYVEIAYGFILPHHIRAPASSLAAAPSLLITTAMCSPECFTAVVGKSFCLDPWSAFSRWCSRRRWRPGASCLFKSLATSLAGLTSCI